jgi:hypothetical protein
MVISKMKESNHLFSLITSKECPYYGQMEDVAQNKDIDGSHYLPLRKNHKI